MKIKIKNFLFLFCIKKDIANSNSSDVDSGISSLMSKKEDDDFRFDDRNSSNKNSTNNKSCGSLLNGGDDESIDSYVTCGDENDEDENDERPAKCSLTTTVTNLSDMSSEKLHFSDADDSLTLTTNNDNNNDNDDNNDEYQNGETKKSAKNKPRPKRRRSLDRHLALKQRLPVYTSIVSELFEGKIISQVQCLECKNVSTTTESFLHLSLPIPSKEYLQSLHNRVVNKQNQLNSLNNSTASGASLSRSESSLSDSSSTTGAYQGWLSWIMDFMKGYIWSSTIKLADCLTAFFSDDDLKGDNMYSCEKCKKLVFIFILM